MSLFLIGMRGAGKSTAGVIAAGRLGVELVDSDRLVESRAGASIARLFAERGEAAFRTLEREVLEAELPRPNRLIATGGGCVLDEAVRTALRRFGRVIWLRGEAAVLAGRIRGSARPSLTGADAVDELAAVLATREPIYRACADAVIETDSRTAEEVASVIEQLWAVLPHHQLR